LSKIIETVPNFSEGRRVEVIREIVEAVGKTPGARILDISSDADHNRSVLTLAGNEEQVMASVLKLFEAAIARIDLRNHRGEHPRLGAVDVVPFVPVKEATMADDPNNLILEHLRGIRADLGDVRQDVREVKQRLTSLEVSVANLSSGIANLHGDFAGQSGRIDRVESRLERIENRLDLRDA